MPPKILHDLLQIEHAGDLTRARINAEKLDSSTVEALGRAFSRLPDAMQGRQLVLDLGAVRYLSSEPLGKLIALHSAMRAAGKELVLDNVREAVYEIFAVTRLTRIFQIHRAGGQSTPPVLASA